MGLILMIILFAVGVIATGVIVYRRAGTSNVGLNDLQAASRPGTSGSQSFDTGNRISH